MRRQDLTVQRRHATGKGAARKMRASGRVPGVLYGEKTEPTPISVDRRTLARMIHGESGENTIFNVTFDGEKQSEEILALVKEPAYDPVQEILLHVDLMRISMDHPINTTVPLHLLGTPAGVKEGGILEHLLRHIEIRCLPQDIPDSIDADVTALQIGQSITVGDLQIPEGVHVLSDLRTAIALVESPAKLAAAAEAAEAKAEEEVPEGEEARAEGREEEEAEGEEKGE